MQEVIALKSSPALDAIFHIIYRTLYSPILLVLLKSFLEVRARFSFMSMMYRIFVFSENAAVSRRFRAATRQPPSYKLLYASTYIFDTTFSPPPRPTTAVALQLIFEDTFYCFLLLIPARLNASSLSILKNEIFSLLSSSSSKATSTQGLHYLSY